VHVTYLSREFTPGVGYASHVTLQYARSIDDGQTFDAPLDVGPRTNIAYAAHLGSDWFLGDYMGLAADPAGAWAVWSRASAPSHPHPYHQTTWAARIEG